MEGSTDFSTRVSTNVSININVNINIVDIVRLIVYNEISYKTHTHTKGR